MTINNDFIFKLAITFFSIGIIYFLLGFHNIDISMNMDDSEIDFTVFYQPQIKAKVYLTGVRFIFTGFTFFILSDLLLIFRFSDIHKNK